jgi:hypothetical protein
MKHEKKYNLIETYIFECIDFSDYQKRPTEKSEQIKYLFEIFRTEKGKVNIFTEKSTFIDWLYGLPSCFKQDYQQFKVIELCEKFGLKQPKNEYQLFDFFYGQLYDSIKYLSIKLK